MSRSHIVQCLFCLYASSDTTIAQVQVGEDGEVHLVTAEQTEGQDLVPVFVDEIKNEAGDHITEVVTTEAGGEMEGNEDDHVYYVVVQ